MGVSEQVEATLSELAKFGIKGEVVDRGKHLAVEWYYADGRHRQTIVSRTASDWRAVLNARSVVRRMLRADNIQLPPPSVVRLEKAFNLPKPADFAAEKIRRLENDVEALSDLILEQNLKLEALEKRLSSLRVSVHFEAELPAAAVVKPLESHKYGRSPAVLNCLSDGNWHTRTEIAKATGIAVDSVSRTLNYLKGVGKVENGQHSMWRRIVAIEAAQQVG